MTTHKNELQLIEGDPLSVFMYGLKSKETRRQYPNRLKVFMEYSGLDGSIEKQGKIYFIAPKITTVGFIVLIKMFVTIASQFEY